ncbi:MAG: PHP domain-containing protein [Firmicutes bacterium]|nr:PHP domain-containing protein [Bacillota bacterium]
MLADLHLHTTESDGTWTPRQVVEEALRLKLAVIAITDHDTTAGLAEAKSSAGQSLEVIPGIELGASASSGDEVHILGYWINPGNPALQDQLKLLRESRIERARKILEKLHSLGVFLEYSQVLQYAQSDVVSRSHIASALLEENVVRSKQEAFTKYIGLGAPAYVGRFKFTPETAVKIILKSGGVPVLAHPGLLRNLEILPSLVQSGLVGLEVVHSSHNSQQTKYFRKLAAEWNLLPSGGSDCHGPGGKDRVFLGDYTIPVEWVRALAARRI